LTVLMPVRLRKSCRGSLTSIVTLLGSAMLLRAVKVLVVVLQ
jgi:hypothetical protein